MTTGDYPEDRNDRGSTRNQAKEERPVKVRLAEIDTPERGQSWAKRAKQALSDKVFGQEVEVRVIPVDPGW